MYMNVEKKIQATAIASYFTLAVILVNLLVS